MSESEKKKRSLYRKNREKWIFAQSVIVAVVTLAILISALVAYQLNKTYYIGYRESGHIDYNVFLKENDFYDSPFLEKDQSYVASLIDNVIADFNYEIVMDTADVNYRYSYTIKSRLEILDDTSDVAIFNPEYELVNVQNKSQSSSNRLVINEIVILNYDQYNDLANQFLETYSLSRTTSSIVVTLEVDVLSDCNAFSGSSVDTYTSELRIPLTTQTVNIEMTSTIPDAEAKMIACTRGAGFEVFKTTAIVLGVVDVLLILLLVAFTCLTKTPDVTYAARVKKILSQYKSYIQKIHNTFDTQGYQVIMVDTFDEMLEIRDTIQAPILMYENEDKTCTKFMIPTDSKLLYQYSIQVEGYKEPPAKPKKPAPAPTTVVKPNITNVVRPVVRVVVTPPSPPPAPIPEPDPEPDPLPEPDPEPEIETVVEEAEVEIEAAEEDMPEVEVIVEEADPSAEETDEEPVEEIVEEAAEEAVDESFKEVEEILASIPEIAEEAENEVDACSLFWEENAAYRHDFDDDLFDADDYNPASAEETVEEEAFLMPEEEMVEEEEFLPIPDEDQKKLEDCLMVPDWDEATDETVAREAEVADGEYKIELNYPIKKLVRGVRNKAEKVFTTLITPDEDGTEDSSEVYTEDE